jgi:hypothetical protein
VSLAVITPLPTGVVISPPPPAPIRTKPSLSLTIEGNNEIRANGRESAKIVAHLIVGKNPGPAPLALTFRSPAPSGTLALSSSSVSIPAGSSDAEIEVTCKKTGSWLIQCDSSDVTFQGPNSLEVKGVLDVSHLGIIVGTNASLVNTQAHEIAVGVYDSDSHLVKSGADRSITVSVSGKQFGSLTRSIPMSATDNTIITSFYPNWIGDVRISAISDGLSEDIKIVHVAFPLSQVLTAFSVGIVGGFLAASRQKVVKKQLPARLIIGAITGTILYMAAVTGALTDQSRQISLQLFGIVIFAVLGGYLGTEVLTLLLRRLGLVDGKDSAESDNTALASAGSDKTT